jgi:outer membrane receptor protein involved in Fe transport
MRLIKLTFYCLYYCLVIVLLFFPILTNAQKVVGKDTVKTTKPATIQLSTVNISAPRPIIERKAGMLIVNLNGAGSGAPIMEVMNQFPGVTVTPDDRITLNGRSVQIYLDGKATTLSAEALAGLLKGISSSSIQKVELIAQPSAKYDAAGNGGIINIIRKQNYKGGLSGNVYAGTGKGKFGKANGGLNLNYKAEAYNVLLNLDYNYNKNFNNSLILSDFVSANGVPASRFISDIQSIRTNANYTPNLGVDFYLSKRSTLSAFVKPGFQFSNRDASTDITDADQGGNIISQSKFINGVDIRVNNFSSGLRLQHKLDTLGRDVTFDLDYYHYGNGNDQNNITYNQVTMLPSTVTQDRVFDVYAFKMDYTSPLGNGRQLDMGLKSSYVNSDNSNFYSDFASRQTDVFVYRESISAIYLNYSMNRRKFSYQLGLRGEYTFGEGGQQMNSGTFTRRYFQPFPSLHFDYKFTQNHSLSLGLNKRVERPGYENLNPLIRIITANNLQQGNPALKPVIAYNADLWYSYKNAFFFGLTYSHSLHDFTSVAVPLSNGIITTTPGNADYSGYTTMQAVYTKQVLPWWYTSTGAILSRRSFKGEVNGLLLQSDGLTALSSTSYHSFALTKDFSFMVLFNYRSKTMERTITNQAHAYVTTGVRQQFFKKRGSAQLNFIDVFKSYRNNYQQNSGTVEQSWINHFETRMVKLNFSYSFGGTIKNTKKSDAVEDERKRTTLNEN